MGVYVKGILVTLCGIFDGIDGAFQRDREGLTLFAACAIKIKMVKFITICLGLNKRSFS